MKDGIKRIICLAMIILLILGLNILIYRYENVFLALKAYGYIGILLSCFILNATVLLPSSSTAIVMSMSTIYNPIIVSVLGALGSALGEFTGYFVGYLGKNVVEKNRLYNRIVGMYNRFPEIAIIIFAIIPLPLFDILGILAGSSSMNKIKFFILCYLGKCIKMLFYAALGYYALTKGMKL